MPRVSVIIPSFNHGKYIAEAIQSALDQTYQDFEIVITDDGSTDNTVNEIRKFNDQRIKLFTFEENRGAAFATRNCVVNAKGEYLAMLSSDDAFLPEKLGKQVRFLDEHPEVWAVFAHAHIIDEEGKDFNDTKHFYYNIFNQPNRTRFEWLNHFFYKGNCLCHPSVLARREVYTTIGTPEPRYAQLGDFYRWIRTCLKHEICIIPEKLIKFRVRTGETNASGARPEVMRRSDFEFSRILKHYLEIDSAENFLKVFPEAEKYGKVEKKLIPYFLARLAIDNKTSPLHQYFGISILFDILGNVEMAETLGKKIGFRHINFITLTGECDRLNTAWAQSLEQELKKRTEWAQSLEQEINNMHTNRANLEAGIKEKEQHIASLAAIVKDREATLNRIYESGGWKTLGIYYKWRGRLLPVNSRRERMTKFVWNIFHKEPLRSKVGLSPKQ